MIKGKGLVVGGPVTKKPYEVYFCIHRKGALVVNAESPEEAAFFVENLPLKTLETQIAEVEVTTSQIEDILDEEMFFPQVKEEEDD